jgi:hypothetical protein
MFSFSLEYLRCLVRYICFSCCDFSFSIGCTRHSRTFKRSSAIQYKQLRIKYRPLEAVLARVIELWRARVRFVVSAILLLTNTMLSSSVRARCSPRSLPSVASAFRRHYAATAPSRPLLGRYNRVPVELARVQSGTNVRLRDYEQQKALKRFSYDLKLKDDLVMPAEGDNFIGASPWCLSSRPAMLHPLSSGTGPNGCSLRPPLSPTFQEVVRNFRGANITVYVLKEGVYCVIP